MVDVTLYDSDDSDIISHNRYVMRCTSLYKIYSILFLFIYILTFLVSIPLSLYIYFNYWHEYNHIM
jgi:hypothetical protein